MSNINSVEIKNAGYQAYRDGLDRSACPYPDDSNAAAWWLEGWERARKDHEEIVGRWEQVR